MESRLRKPLTLYTLEKAEAQLALNGRQHTQLKHLVLDYGHRLMKALDRRQELEFRLELLKTRLRGDQLELWRCSKALQESRSETRRLQNELHWEACRALSPEQRKTLDGYLAA